MNEHVDVYGRAFYSNNEVIQQIAPSGTFFNTFSVPLSNPFLTTAIRNDLCEGLRISETLDISQAQCDAAATVTDPTAPGYVEAPTVIGRRFVELGPRRSEYQSNVFQFTLGLRGNLFGNWTYDVSGQYGETDQIQSNQGQGLASRLQQALRAVDRNTCVNPAGGCAPVNLFGAEGSLGSPAFLRFLNASTSVRTATTLATAIANVSGDLGEFKSPFAENRISLAFGSEYRRYTAAIIPDVASATQSEILGAGAPTPAFAGAYDVVEGFFEINAPLLENAFLAKAVTLEGGVRLSAYSNTGFNSTWKVGGTWEISDGYKLRSVFQRAVRSPGIGELFSPTVISLNNLAVDPCQGVQSALAPGLRTLCQLTGVPATAASVAPPSAGQVNSTTGGNPDLDVERAKTFTVGIVLNPKILKGFTFSADYFNINIVGAVSAPTPSDILDPCYNPAQNPTFAFVPACALIGRNPLTGGLNGGGETAGLIQSSSNLGVINTSGLDFASSYSFALEDIGLGSGGGGSVDWSINATYTFENRFQATPTSIDRNCVGFYSSNCSNIQPEWQFNQRVTYSWSIWDFSLQHRYIGEVDVEPLVNLRSSAGVRTFLDAFSGIPGRNYLDLTARATINKNLDLSFTVDNLVNRNPPVVGNNIGSTSFNSGNTYPTVYDALGRTFTIGARLRF